MRSGIARWSKPPSRSTPSMRMTRSVWTEMIAHDAFGYLMDHGGGLTRAAGDNFRAKILSRGNTVDYAELYRAYAGRDPKIDAMVEARGLQANDGK